MLTFAPDHASLTGRVGQDIDGIRRSKKPFVRATEGKGRFRTLLSAYFKLRKLEFSHRYNATERSRG